MSDAIISVEGLGKKYAIRHQGQQRSHYKTFREALTQGATRLVTRWSRDSREAAKAAQAEEFWALRDVSFELQRGQVLGIIGRNGAGKSTLLKILSRITEPSEGRVILRGRVASLLEVGTGFHPELTGRENIFLNGSILGMTRTEMKRKFDEIVDFAGVEKFLDTPVKRYSSGMYVRLAFAVAAHIEPEILVVDEVLAVGDAEFQKKCMGKMKDVSAREGRTVLLVSHNMAAIETLCSRNIVLNNGHILFDGDPRKSLLFYQSLQAPDSFDIGTRTDRAGSGVAKCIGLVVRDCKGAVQHTLTSGDAFEVILTIDSHTLINNVLPGINLSNALGQRITTFWHGFAGPPLTLRPGLNSVMLRVKRLDLTPGDYKLSIVIGLEGEAIDAVDDACELIVSVPTRWSPVRFPTLDHGPLFTEFEWISHG